MATRKAPSNDGDENSSPSNKRQRLAEAMPARISSLEALNDNCLIHILSLIPHEDLDSFAEFSRRCREARRHDSLDQTRTGTIVCRAGLSPLELHASITEKGWNNVFSGNRTRLRVEDFESMYGTFLRGLGATTSEDIPRPASEARLTGVTSLDLSSNDPDGTHLHGNVEEGIDYVSHLFWLLPNMREMDLSHVIVTLAVGSLFFEGCPNLKRLTWTGSLGSVMLDGIAFTNLQNMTELFLDDARFFMLLIHGWPPSGPRDFEVESLNGEENFYMLQHCHRLEHLSIKGAAWYSDDPEGPHFPLTQDMIIKFVRHTPTLRWLRSDLTEENIAMLKEERPEVMFFSE